MRRGKSVLAARLGLQPLDYAMPLFNLAAMGGLLAILLKFDRGLDHLSDLTTHAWVPLALSPLALGMVRAYPRREVVHLSVGLLCWGVVSLIAPSLFDPAFGALALAAPCVGLELTALVIRPGEHSWVKRAGLDEPDLLPIVRGWSLGAGGLCVLLAGLVLVSEMAKALLGVRFEGPAITPLDWWAMLAAIVLLGVRIGLVPLDSRQFGSLGAEGFMLCLELIALTILWWLGAESSPLARWGLSAGGYFPLITAIATVTIAELNRRLFRLQIWRLSTVFILTLSILSAFFTLGRENPTTVATLVLIALAAGHWAIAVGEPRSAYLGSLAWTAAGFVAGLVVAPALGLWIARERLICAALGGLVAGFAILAVAGLLRRVERTVVLRKTRPALDPRASFIGLAMAVEQVAFVGVLLAAGLVGVASAGPSPLAGWLSAAGMVALLAVALCLLVLVPRWQREWLVYLSQAALVGAYVLYRLAHPLDVTSDSAILTLFAFVDLGIAEVLDRLRLPIYARPTRYASLVMPVLPLVLIVGTSGLDDLTVFHLLAAGTFYAVACGTLRWKELGYAAGATIQRGALGFVGAHGLAARRSSPVSSRAGRPVGDSVRGIESRRAGA